MATKKRYKGYFCKYQSSFNGSAVLEVSMSRMTNRGTTEYLQLEIEIKRSTIACVVHALKAFADKEREAVAGLPL